MEDKTIAKLAVETVKDFLKLTQREPITGGSVRFLERMIVDRLVKGKIEGGEDG